MPSLAPFPTTAFGGVVGVGLTPSTSLLPRTNLFPGSPSGLPSFPKNALMISQFSKGTLP